MCASRCFGAWPAAVSSPSMDVHHSHRRGVQLAQLAHGPGHGFAHMPIHLDAVLRFIGEVDDPKRCGVTIPTTVGLRVSLLHPTRTVVAEGYKETAEPGRRHINAAIAQQVPGEIAVVAQLSLECPSVRAPGPLLVLVMINRICSACFTDEDLRAWIRSAGGPRGCDVCGKYDSPTCELSELCDYIESCLRKYWGFAVDQLPYISAEGGYQGVTWHTYDLLLEEVGIELPRDSGDRLFHALVQGMTDELWCQHDWLSLDRDVALLTSWERFCKTVKHQRRFFFHAEGESDHD